jgi:endoglucanase
MTFSRALAAAFASTAMLLASAPAAPAVTGSPLPGSQLLVPQHNTAREAADRLRRSSPQDAALLDRIARQPVAMWISGQHAREASHRAAVHARSSGRIPVLVA